MRMHKPRKAAASVFERAFSNYRPPEKLTVSQWAEKRRVLSRESSAEAGKWRNDRTPYMVEPMDAFNDPNVHDITVVAMSQTGKSELELNIIGSVIDNDPQSILYIQPNIEEAKKFSKMRVAPMIRDCKTLREKVAEVKSRDGSNTTLQKSFPGGILTMVGSQTPSALASMPVPIVVGDEIDRFARSAGSEGDPWELAEKRTTTYFNAKRVAVSTPTNEGDSRIADLFDDGTQERWRTRCPDCGEWSEVLFDDIKFDENISSKI
jgi:phage terminase large subunit GpA-like protein